MSTPHFEEHAEITAIGPLPTGIASLAGYDGAAVAKLVEDPGAPRDTRLAAGGLLALWGDPRIGMVPTLLRIPGGDVETGLPPDSVPAVVQRWAHVGVEASWIEKETPAYLSRLADFWIGGYPVTNSQYRDFLAATGHRGRPSTWYLGAYPWERANHPVCGVTPGDIDAYLGWLSERSGHRYRLPTEAEWEHAAKGFDGLEFPWGQEFDPTVTNTRESGIHATTPVGMFPAGNSPFGVADMGGNVEECVADWYAPYPGGPDISDHLTAALGRYRITRGGSFSRFGDLARTRRRHGTFPSPLYPAGFRVASSAPPPGA
ncbi:MAG: formylglycine-generating enzyme family protein [Streptomycetales bacterium]